MRSKSVLLAGIALAGGIALYGATQTWLTLSLVDGAAAFGWFDVTGQQLNQSLSPIAIAALAAALALTIAGRVFRVVLGVLVALLGAGVAAIAASVMISPENAASGQLAEATGLSGGGHLDLVTAITSSPLILVTLGSGILLAVLGILVLVFGAKWKSAGRRYETEVGQPQVSNGDEPDRISDWEAMSEGVDPSDDDPREDSQGMAGSR